MRKKRKKKWKERDKWIKIGFSVKKREKKERKKLRKHTKKANEKRNKNKRNKILKEAQKWNYLALSTRQGFICHK